MELGTLVRVVAVFDKLSRHLNSFTTSDGLVDGRFQEVDDNLAYSTGMELLSLGNAEPEYILAHSKVASKASKNHEITSNDATSKDSNDPVIAQYDMLSRIQHDDEEGRHDEYTLFRYRRSNPKNRAD